MELNSPNLACVRAKNEVTRFAIDRFGRPSEWRRSLLLANLPAPRLRTYTDVPAVIGDAIIGEERTRLCSRILRSTHNAKLSQILRERRGLSGNPDIISAALTQEEQHQLILTLTDREILAYIDELIAAQEIIVATAERRVSKTYAFTGPGDKKCEISSLGIRSLLDEPTVEFTARIVKAYNDLGFDEDLSWRLRGYEGQNREQSI
jgi:hypothetical protein